MEKNSGCCFDLKILLTKGNLNVRQAAESEPSLTVGEYFELLTGFIELAPAALLSLSKFAEINENVKDWRNIEAVILSLNQLRSDKYLPDLHAVSNARSKGDSRLAALHAKTMIDDFNSFYLQIISAKTDALPDGAPGVQASLKKLIQFYDDEEANRKMMVLAVDDSPSILTAIEAVLNKTYKVFKLPKPEMLESILTQVTPDLFLLDYRMPGLSGFDLVPIIRRCNEHKVTPIIFLTSEGTMDHVSAAIALGACDFIVKPFQADMLRQKIAKHIVRKKNF
jgi:CheY-like chemotaxis protein